MRTYRLQFSKNPEVVQRRLQKARDSLAQRVLCVGFENEIPVREMFTGNWALETTVGSPMAEWNLWDEIHLCFKKPSPVPTFSTKPVCWILKPDRCTSEKEWISFLRTFNFRDLQEKVYLEFEPWRPERPELYTVQEVAQFLYRLKYHFPEWTPCRRPGVELWDSRIPSDFELEASQWKEKTWNWRPQAPSLSVVIPTYNNKHFVYKVLEHLGRQKLDGQDFEVLLVDDGSSDETFHYLQTFGIPHGLQVRWFYWPRPRLRNRGDSFFRAGHARNLGVRRARGEFLVFLDSDILVSEAFLERTKNLLETWDVVQFPRWHIRQEKSHSAAQYSKITREDCYIEEKNYWGPFFQSERWMALPFFWKYTCTYALALRKTDFLEAGRFRRSYVSYGFEDTELGYHLARAGKQFHLAAEEKVLHLTSYSQSEYQMSQSRRLRLLRRTARQFFLSTLCVENYQHFFGLMAGEHSFWTRFKSGFYWKDKSRYLDEVSSGNM